MPFRKGFFKRKRDVLDSRKRPEEFEIVGDKIWFEGNPDKSKKYRRKKFQQKEFLTPTEAEKFLEVTGEWLGIFILGEKGFPKLPYTISGLPSEEAIAKAKASGHKINRDTIRFSREELENYRKKNVLRKKFPTNARPQQK